MRGTLFRDCGRGDRREDFRVLTTNKERWYEYGKLRMGCAGGRAGCL